MMHAGWQPLQLLCPQAQLGKTQSKQQVDGAAFYMHLFVKADQHRMNA